jgi:hypothetical protein
MKNIYQKPIAALFLSLGIIFISLGLRASSEAVEPEEFKSEEASGIGDGDVGTVVEPAEASRLGVIGIAFGAVGAAAQRFFSSLVGDGSGVSRTAAPADERLEAAASEDEQPEAEVEASDLSASYAECDEAAVALEELSARRESGLKRSAERGEIFLKKFSTLEEAPAEATISDFVDVSNFLYDHFYCGLLTEGSLTDSYNISRPALERCKHLPEEVSYFIDFPSGELAQRFSNLVGAEGFFRASSHCGAKGKESLGLDVPKQEPQQNILKLYPQRIDGSFKTHLLFFKLKEEHRNRVFVKPEAHGFHGLKDKISHLEEFFIPYKTERKETEKEYGVGSTGTTSTRGKVLQKKLKEIDSEFLTTFLCDNQECFHFDEKIAYKAIGKAIETLSAADEDASAAVGGEISKQQQFIDQLIFYRMFLNATGESVGSAKVYALKVEEEAGAGAAT